MAHLSKDLADNVVPDVTDQQVEGVSFDVYVHLETRIQNLRTVTMNAASRLAHSEGSDGKVRVEHVDRALETLTSYPEALGTILLPDNVSGIH